MPDRVSLLSGDITWYLSGENNRRAFAWTGSTSSTATRTLNELYSASQAAADESAQMDNLVPFRADTPDIYRIINQTFVPDDLTERLTGGSLFSAGWIEGSTEHILIKGLDSTSKVDFSIHDIGRTIVGAVTGDTGTLLDFNHQRDGGSTGGLVWIRPDDPASGGDDFDNATEGYSVQGDAYAQVWQVDAGSTAFSDQTSNANSTGTNDWVLFPASEAIGDYAAFGFGQEFSKLVFRSSGGTSGSGGAVTWEYWSDTSSTWGLLTGVSDGTSNFNLATAAADQEVTFDPPTDWGSRTLDVSGDLFYVRARITSTYATNPVYDTGNVGGQGTGFFATHPRHGTVGAGESAWAGGTAIGTIEANSKIYIFQSDKDSADADWNEIKVIGTKSTDSWWQQKAPVGGANRIDILLKTKEADSVIGANPDNQTQAIATWFVQQYSKTYSYFIARTLATAGGNTVVPFASGDDLDNTTGHRRFTTDNAAGSWGSTDVDEVIEENGNTNNKGVITALTGTDPTYTVSYYLIGTQEDYVNNDVVQIEGSTARTLTLDANSSAVGPALDSTIAVSFGATTEDINNGSGARPYSIRIDPASLSLTRLYERSKFITRRGSTELLINQDGEEYVGNELQIEYSGQSGAWVEGVEVIGSSSSARSIIVADHDDGATGDVILNQVRGTYSTDDVLYLSTSTGNTANVDSIRTITPVAAARFGTFAGGNFFGAPGVCITSANLIGGEEQSYQLIDDDGIVQIPPNTQSITVTNLEVGDTVSCFRTTGTNILKTQFTLDAGNTQGSTTLTVQSTIATSNPTNANSKVRVTSPSGQDHRYRYDSYSSNVFALSPPSSGTADAGSSNTSLIDAAADFGTDEIEVGDYVRNIDDGYSVRVTAVSTDSTALTTEDGGTTWASKDYEINKLIETYSSSVTAYVPYIDRVADSTSESNQLIYTSDIPVRVDVRRNAPTAILPFTQDVTIGSAGRSVATIRTADEITST